MVIGYSDSDLSCLMTLPSKHDSCPKYLGILWHESRLKKTFAHTQQKRTHNQPRMLCTSVSQVIEFFLWGGSKLVWLLTKTEHTSRKLLCTFCQKLGNWKSETVIGGFQLVDLIRMELKCFMTSYEFECSHWWEIYL